MAVSSNFDFLAVQDERLCRLGALAERYFFDDAPAALIKLRQLAEFIAKDVAARHALLPKNAVTFDDILRTLKLKSLLPREVADLFFHLKRVGNAAVHEGSGTAGEALEALKIARTAAVWFHRSYGNAPEFKPGPFVPPASPVDATIALVAELDQLRARVRASADSEAKTRLAHQEAVAARLKSIAEAEARETERQFWERYAAETETGLRETEAALRAAQASAVAAPAQQLDQLAQFATRQADKVDLDEPTTRVLIDSQLRSAGWIVDSVKLRHSAGVRPQPGQAIAIAEWPTDSGPVDYAFFIEGRCVAVAASKPKPTALVPYSTGWNPPSSPKRSVANWSRKTPTTNRPACCLNASAPNAQRHRNRSVRQGRGRFDYAARRPEEKPGTPAANPRLEVKRFAKWPVTVQGRSGFICVHPRFNFHRPTARYADWSK